MGTFLSYIMAVDAARMVEMGKERKDTEARKRRYGNNIKDIRPSRPKEEPSVQPEFSSDGEAEQTFVPHSSSRLGTDKSRCFVCGKFHRGMCYHARFVCNQCEQVGHIKRECPQLASRLSRISSTPSEGEESNREVCSGRGRTSRTMAGRGRA